MSLDSQQRQKALELLVSTFKVRAKEKLQNSGRGIFTGKLLDSITGEVQFVDDDYHFFISMEDYGVFIDEGVNGVGFEKTKSGKVDRRFKSNRSVVKDSPFSFKDKKPPLEAISPWAKAKGLNPFAIQNSVYRKGIKGIHFFQDTVDYEWGKLADYLIEVEAQNILNNFGND